MLKKHKSFKIYLGASFTFSREDNVIEEKYMRMNPPHLITSIDSFLKSPIFEELIRFELEEQQQGSGFNIGNVSYIDLNILKSTPLKASSYIDLPKDIKNKKAIINIKNTDNKCFLWSILAHLYPQERDCERVSKYKKYENKLETGDLGILKEFQSIRNMRIN